MEEENNVLEETKEKVEDTSLEQVKTEEPKNEEVLPVSSGNNKKGGNKVVVIVMAIIIVALLAVLLVLLLGGKDKNDKNNTEEKTENTNSEPKENTENTDIEPTTNPSEVKTIELDFAQLPCGGVVFSMGKGTVEVGNISAREKLGMLSTALLKLVGEEKLKNLTTENKLELDFNILEEAKKYFDIDTDMEKQIEEGFGTGFYIFSQKNNKSTLELLIGGCIGPDNAGYYTKEKDSKKDNNTLIKSYYYYYVTNSDQSVVIGKDNDYDITTFPASYYKEKDDPEPVYKDIVSKDVIDYNSFNTLDVYYDLSNDNMKLTKVVFNTK